MISSGGPFWLLGGGGGGSAHSPCLRACIVRELSSLERKMTTFSLIHRLLICAIIILVAFASSFRDLLDKPLPYFRCLARRHFLVTLDPARIDGVTLFLGLFLELDSFTSCITTFANASFLLIARFTEQGLNHAFLSSVFDRMSTEASFLSGVLFLLRLKPYLAWAFLTAFTTLWGGLILPPPPSPPTLTFLLLIQNQRNFAQFLIGAISTCSCCNQFFFLCYDVTVTSYN